MTDDERAELQKHLDALDGLRSLVGNIDAAMWGKLWDDAYAQATECANRILASGERDA
jgi:hypothetical protein